MRSAPRLLAASAIALAIGGCPGGGGQGALRVFAAASLVDLMAELGPAFEARQGVPVELNVAGSNTLAQQILAAPVADVFLSADLHWIEVLEGAGRLVAGSRRALLGNRLVLIAHRDAELRLAEPAGLADAGFSHLAVADPAAVPAGRYARAALEAIEAGGGSLWAALAPRLAPALDVRAALALVESDPRIVGIVYRTDARQSGRVRVLYEFPRDGPAAATYYGALVTDSPRPRLGSAFLELAGGPEGRQIAARHGFEVPDE